MVLTNLKVAIVHDWLVVYGGAERVLEQILKIFPTSDLFALVDFLPDEHRKFINNKTVSTSFVQKLPFTKKKYRQYLPVMALAVEQFDLSEYDLIISSSHAIAKGVITKADQFHVCMCYSPMRYAWDLYFQYLKETDLEKGVKSIFVRWLLHKLRIWDVRTANGVDEFVAISGYVKKRIWRTYRRDSFVIYPPVDVDKSLVNTEKEDFYLTASRMVPYKKIDLIVEAFTEKLSDKKLYVIGTGPDFDKIKSLAGSNVVLLGYQPREILLDYMRRAKAFLFAAEEDFGITPLEAQACGTPVVAYGKGGALETIVGLDENYPTGVFFYRQTVDAVCKAVLTFEKMKGQIKPEFCVENSRRFSVDKFVDRFSRFVEQEYIKWSSCHELH